MLNTNLIYITEIETPLGKMTAGATDSGICLLEFDEEERIEKHQKHFLKTRNLVLQESESQYFPLLRKQLNDYFDRKLFKFNIPLDMIGSDFQVKVWNILLTIPYGLTRSYRQQAILLGNIKTVRAVASANGDNSVSILIPCHRVIGSNGSMTGYGGKIWRKKFLLELESDQLDLFRINSIPEK